PLQLKACFVNTSFRQTARLCRFQQSRRSCVMLAAPRNVNASKQRAGETRPKCWTLGRITIMRRIIGFIVRASLAVACLALLPIGSLRAADYPTRPPHIIVGYPAGGSTDIVARLIGDWLSKRLGQQFIVENRPGAGNNLATDAVAKAPPDGYTLI